MKNSMKPEYMKYLINSLLLQLKFHKITNSVNFQGIHTKPQIHRVRSPPFPS